MIRKSMLPRTTLWELRRVCVLFLISGICSSTALAADSGHKPFTVRDSIGLTNVLEFETAEGDKAPALFSPDRSHFVILTRRGDLDRNVNVEKLLLFDVRDIKAYLASSRSSSQSKLEPRAKMLVTVDAKQPWEGIMHVIWHGNQELWFTAKRESGNVQAFSVDIRDGKMKQLTHSASDVIAFAGDAGEVMYYALASEADAGPRAVEWRSFGELIEPNGSGARGSPLVELFVESKREEKARRIDTPVSLLGWAFQSLWIAPTGDYAIGFSPTVSWPSSWADYKIPHYDLFGYSPDRMSGDYTSPEVQNRAQYELIDLRNGSAKPLLNAPSGFLSQNGTPQVVFWTSDGKSVIVSNTFLPLDTGNQETDKERGLGPAIAEVDLASGKITEIAPEPYATPENEGGTAPRETITAIEWNPKENRLTVRKRVAGKESNTEFKKVDGTWQSEAERAERAEVNPEFSVSKKEALNERPRLYAHSDVCACQKLLYDPNPGADQFEFGHAELLNWTDANKIDWHGEVVYPTGYVKGKKYPLVVQTHGFNPDEFLVDGPDGYTTAFAAQPLANAGFLVLQIGDNRQAMTLDEREGALYAEGFHAAIETLVSEGIADPSKIGLIAFSRTGWHTLYLLKQYPNLLAAVTLADAGLIGYVADLLGVNLSKDFSKQFAKVVGGGIKKPEDWIGKSPMYDLSGLGTPVRLESNSAGSAMGTWEMYALLRFANRPVDFWYFPQGNHILFSPVNRLGSQGGNVDWFRFWLQGFEDPDPKKAEQYARWKHLRSEK
jgi:hypothetical protein